MNVTGAREIVSQQGENSDSGADFMQVWYTVRGRIALLPIGFAALCLFILFHFLSIAQATSVQQNRGANTIVVNTLMDEQAINGNCSLREAITAANINYTVDKCLAGSVYTDTITFAVAGTITLTEQLPYIQSAGSLLIDGGSGISLTTDYRARLMWVNPNARLALRHITLLRSGLTNNYYIDTNGGGLYNNGGSVTIEGAVFKENTSWMYSGGAVFNNGTMTVTHSVFRDNWSWNEGGGINNTGKLIVSDSIFWGNGSTEMWGGALANSGTLHVQRSTFVENNASQGGAIGNEGQILINNSTFSHNWSYISVYNPHFAGAIHNIDEAEINHTTFVGNPDYDEPSIYNDENGMLTLHNSILTRDPPYTNCLGIIIDGGFNIDSQNTCGFNPANGSLVNTDPLLEPLHYNGGATWTHALQTDSPAIDNADPRDCPASDQRGVPRPYDGDGDGEAICDIGAYEVAPPGTPRTTQTSITSISPLLPLINKPLIINFKVISFFGIPTGVVTVTVSDHAESCVGNLTGGSGACSLILAEPGTYTLTASYGGQGDYLPSSGSWVQEMNLYGAFIPQVLRDYPASLRIVWSGIRLNPLGTYELIGQVVNVSDAPVYNATLTAYLYNQFGQSMGIYVGTTALPAIFPKEKMPFEFDIGQSEPNNYQLFLNWTYDSILAYHPVSVISQQVSNNCPYLTISGEIRNDQPIELKSIQVIVEPGGASEFYGVATLGADSLLPGETTPFTHTQNYIVPPCPSEFTVQGEGYLNP